MYTYTYLHIYKYKYIFIHIYIHIYIFTYIYTYICIYIYINICTHADIHIYWCCIYIEVYKGGAKGLCKCHMKRLCENRDTFV